MRLHPTPTESEYKQAKVHFPEQLPPPLNFEVILARKIKSQSTPTIQIFSRLDEDGDGYLSTNDMKKGMNNFFDLELSDDQVAAIFKRASYFSSKSINSPENGEPTETKMTAPMFLRYVDNTAKSTIVSSSTIFGSYITMKAAIKSKKIFESPVQKSEIYRSRRLQARALQLIRQNVSTSSSRSKSINTQSFLNMDTNRNNEITRDEFRNWLRNKGLNMTDAEMKLLLGKWQKEEGLSVKEFGVFIDTLAADLIANSCSRSKGQQSADELDLSVLSMNQRDSDDTGHIDDSHKSDAELIWVFLNHFRDIKKSYVQGFHYLDKDDNKYLCARDIQAGLEGCGVCVSMQRCHELMGRFVTTGGRMDKPSFVRFITSAPIMDYPHSETNESIRNDSCHEVRDPPDE